MINENEKEDFFCLTNLTEMYSEDNPNKPIPVIKTIKAHFLKIFNDDILFVNDKHNNVIFFRRKAVNNILLKNAKESQSTPQDLDEEKERRKKSERRC